MAALRRRGARILARVIEGGVSVEAIAVRSLDPDNRLDEVLSDEPRCTSKIRMSTGPIPVGFRVAKPPLWTLEVDISGTNFGRRRDQFSTPEGPIFDVVGTSIDIGRDQVSTSQG
jgi:hypothetical protein